MFSRFFSDFSRIDRRWVMLLVLPLTLCACQPSEGVDSPAAVASASVQPVASAAKTAASVAASVPVVFDDAPTPELAELALATGIPPAVTAALARSRIPTSQLSLLVMPAEGGTPLVNLHSHKPMNPASVMKLVTTAAALDVLGSSYVWRTPVWADGAVRDGVLQGNLYIQGRGDPKLVVEKLWLLLQQVRQAGIESIEGDLVLDNTAFESSAHDAANFDGEPLRSYNAAPEALLVNFKSLELTFSPDAISGVARVSMVPPLLGVRVDATLPLTDEACGVWQNRLGAVFTDSRAIRFTGSYPASCGKKSWLVAYSAPDEFSARAVAGMWMAQGGSIRGSVRMGSVPAAVQQHPVLVELSSPALSEVIRDINKYSNNVMAQQVFFTMGLQAGNRGSTHSAKEAVGQWWRNRLGDTPAPRIDNGSGLSRTQRISASSLGALLQAVWKSPVMPEFVSSMPVAGIDGTLRRSRVRNPGSSHLKTGSLNNVAALAGYVLSNDGHYYVLVAMANDANAAAARPAFAALVDWTINLPDNAVAPDTLTGVPVKASKDM